MAISNKIENFRMTINPAFTEKAEALKPRIINTTIIPSPERSKELKKGESVVFDFGNHQVGYLSFRIESAGSPPDAPAKLRVRFAEMAFELEEDWEAYSGEISSSWLQEEIVFADLLPAELSLPRRHAFRYVEIKVLDVSPKYRAIFENVRCVNVSSADYANVPEIMVTDPELADLDRVSLRTMHECMQSVFEDGPKRDRRLWLGDLRLQALGNYITFANNDLVKRCLYLFAGLTMNEGRVGACIFHEPVLQVDDTVLFDYSLFFVTTLYDYYKETHDYETLRELYPTAKRQVELSLRELDMNHVVMDREGWWCFLDWGEGLNKQAGAQAVLICAVRDLRAMTEILGFSCTPYDRLISGLCRGAMEELWDEEQHFFVSGPERQVSWASQVWFVLAGIFPKEENAKLLRHLMEVDPPVRMNTPYMYHYFVEALFACGMEAEAVSCLKEYWGEMIRDGADTFFEVYDPLDKEASPYGGRIINSYCHAWSSTPAYFIRKYLV